MPAARARAAALALATTLIASPALAAPAVVADIAPIHSIVARVMAGVGEPELLLPPGATPHHYSLRPSEAELLEQADIVFWVGEGLTPWLAGPLASLAAAAERVELMEAEGVRLLPIREGGAFEPHHHDHDHHDHDHDHEAAHEDEDEHDHGHDHDHDHARDDGHAHDHDHGHAEEHDHAHAHGPKDAHIWLDPVNAVAMAEAVAATLAEADPANAEAYRANAAAFGEEMGTLAAELADALAGLEDRAFIVFHDAYQYFEDRFGLRAAGSIALHDADQPSPARMAAIQERVQEAEVACVFAEPQFEPRLIETAIEGSAARRGVLDPIGAELAPGPELYPALLRQLAADLRACLEG